MTREELIRQIARFAEKCGPFDAPEAWVKEDRIAEWLALAPEGWFDVLLDILTHPPDWVQYEKDHKLWLEDGWEEWQFALLIGEGANQDLDYRLSQIGPLLNRNDTRQLILWAYKWVDTTEEILPWLKPLVNQVSMLTEGEQIALAIAVAGLQPETSLPLLLQMREVIPETAVEVQQNINSFLPHPYFQSSLSSNIRSFVP